MITEFLISYLRMQIILHPNEKMQKYILKEKLIFQLHALQWFELIRRNNTEAVYLP